ncbi:MAG: tetratricopeptide repeat protein, partial [Armatimonadota bacterium]
PAAPAPATPAAAPAPPVTTAEPVTVTPPVEAPPPISVKEALAISADVVFELASLNNKVADQYFKVGKWDEAVEALDRVIQLDATGAESYAAAAWLLWSAGKTEEALRYCQRMVDANPNDIDANFEYGFFLYRIKRYAEAAIYFGKAFDLGIEPPRSHMYGHMLERLGRRDEAMAFWKKQLERTPDNEVAQKQLERLSKPEPTTPEPPDPATTAPNTP